MSYELIASTMYYHHALDSGVFALKLLQYYYTTTISTTVEVSSTMRSYYSVEMLTVP